MTRHEILAGEITNDLAGLGYSPGMTDKEILALMLAENRVISVDVPIGSLEAAILLNGLLGPISAVPDTSPAYGAARALLKLVMGPTSITQITYSDPTTRAQVDGMADALRDAGHITAAQHDLLLSLGRRTVSRAQEIGVPGVTEREIKEAR